MTLTDNLQHALSLAGIQSRFDLGTRILYSTDASIYRIEPVGVSYPRSSDEISAIMTLAANHGVPVLPRGSGSSLAGQAIGPALIIDCSRYLTRILEVNPDERTAIVEPGVIMSDLNRRLAKHALQFGPDPASAERATMGGSLANNASGAHSIIYGMAADHLLAADVILSDGTSAKFGESRFEDAMHLAGGSGLISSIYRTSLEIREKYRTDVIARFPRTWRRASGYNINYLLPWSPGAPPGWGTQFEGNDGSKLPYPPVAAGTINLAPLLAGSEGTLAIIQRASIRLVPLPASTVLVIFAFPGIAEACDATPELLSHSPSAVELVPGMLIELAREVPAFASQLAILGSFVTQERVPDLLAVEFSGDDFAEVKSKIDAVRQIKGLSEPLVLESKVEQKQVWAVRKVGLGLLSSRPGEKKSVAFIEDLSIPVENLGQFVRQIEQIFEAHGTHADIYAHASAGCLHIRPLLNLKSTQGVEALRSIAQEAVNLTVSLGGAVSGEHGVGLARSEWLREMLGENILAAFAELKAAADPRGLLNPGKFINSQRMDENLRYGAAYQTNTWSTQLDFAKQGGLTGAIEMCNGAGVCRKSENVMCPSFQATREEMHSTRGRANLLRAMISLPAGSADRLVLSKAVYEALDLCLACKGCKAECPSAVDMAKLKYEFLDQYYKTHRHKIRDYLFGYIGLFLNVAKPFAWIVNNFLNWNPLRRMAEKGVGVSASRKLPLISIRSLHQLAKSYRRSDKIDCLVLSDAFTEYFYPNVGLSALSVLTSIGLHPALLPVLGAGRTLISKGFLAPARRHALELVKSIQRLDPEGKLPIVGIEPSEIYTLRDEYLDLFPDDQFVRQMAERAWMLDEFLIRPGHAGIPRIERIKDCMEIGETPQQVLLHGHCYQKAQPLRADGYPVGVSASQKLLESCGYAVKVLDTGCCGVAGAFGYEAEHYEVSINVGNLTLLPAIRKAMEGGSVRPLIAASGVSCQTQIVDGTDQPAYHPIVLVERAITPR